ncbi:Gfo/Idh/MocA family protein [Dactylosporangium sp. CA-092794]|uniref:Gfo/Idh/MocA family protein n=1 Tax=Dactylosporangium sp. CA-092794 TaxID=3239929 RepID=UPI003D92F015
MTNGRIRVGIVGASPDGGWAAQAHLPALAMLDEYRVTAVATTRTGSARRAAERFRAPSAFTSAAELAAHPEVDLVVVSVRTAGHAEAVRAAIGSGKHVLSEWPLGVDADEATALARAADGAGVVHAVGLQVYHSPGARFVRDLLAAGRLGRVESVSFVGAADPLGGSRIPQSLAWSTTPAAATGVLMIMAGHTLAAIDQIAGELVEVSAMAASRHDRVTVIETGQLVDNHIAGQLAFVGRFGDGALASISLHGGSAPGPDGFLLKVAGTEGTLTITPARTGEYMNWADWRVGLAPAGGAPRELPVPARYRTVPSGAAGGPVANVAALYRDLATAIREHRPAHPDFHTAVRHQRTLAAIDRAARTGVCQVLETPRR